MRLKNNLAGDPLKDCTAFSTGIADEGPPINDVISWDEVNDFVTIAIQSFINNLLTYLPWIWGYSLLSDPYCFEIKMEPQRAGCYEIYEL